MACHRIPSLRQTPSEDQITVSFISCNDLSVVMMSSSIGKEAFEVLRDARADVDCSDSTSSSLKGPEAVELRTPNWSCDLACSTFGIKDCSSCEFLGRFLIPPWCKTSAATPMHATHQKSKATA